MEHLTAPQQKLLRRSAEAQKQGLRVNVYPMERNTFNALHRRGLMNEAGERGNRTYSVTQAGVEWVDKHPKRK